MNTLEELNGYSSTSLTYTENRPSGVVFSYPTARNINVTLSGLTHVVQRRIDIEEVVGGATAQVTYEIDLDTVAGTVTWSTIPTGCTVIHTGNKWTITGITTSAIWDIVAAPTITLPATFVGSFSYDATIKYYETGTGYKTKQWTVGIFLPDAGFATSATLTCSANRLRDVDATLPVYAGVDLFGVKVLGCTMSMSCTAVKTAVFDGPTYTVSTSLYAKPKTWLYADQTITINNPYPETGGNFGGYALEAGDQGLQIVRDQYILSNYDANANYVASAFSIGNGTKSFDIPRQSTPNGSTYLIASDDFAIVQENNRWYLYKFNTSGDMYTYVDDIAKIGGLNRITDTHFISGNPTANSNDGAVYVYSLDATTGFTLETTITAPLATGDRYLGTYITTNDTYYVITEGNQGNIRVYDFATNTLQRTITNSSVINSLTLRDDHELLGIVGSKIVSWDITDGSQNYSFYPGGFYIEGSKIDKVSDNLLVYRVVSNGQITNALQFVNLVDQDVSHRITTTDSITNYALFGDSRLVLGFYAYTGTKGSEGKIEIRIET